MGILTALALSAQLAGCAPLGMGPNILSQGMSPDVPVTQAVMPSVVRPYARIDDTLYCIRDSGVLGRFTFVVGSFADSTGKINSVSVGSTGAFVPQGGSAAYLTDALSKAGGRVVSTYFGAPAVRAPAQYAVNGIFNSLDFGTPYMADVRVGGVGPTMPSGWAQLSLSIQLDEAGTPPNRQMSMGQRPGKLTPEGRAGGGGPPMRGGGARLTLPTQPEEPGPRLNRQMSMVQRPVKFTQVGAGMGKVWNDNLVTGYVGVQNQERLQFEALNGPIALGVIDVLLKEFPAARTRCGNMVDDLLNPADPGDPATAVPDYSRRPRPPAAPATPPATTKDWQNTQRMAVPNAGQALAFPAGAQHRAAGATHQSNDDTIS